LRAGSTRSTGLCISNIDIERKYNKYLPAPFNDEEYTDEKDKIEEGIVVDVQMHITADPHSRAKELDDFKNRPLTPLSNSKGSIKAVPKKKNGTNKLGNKTLPGSKGRNSPIRIETSTKPSLDHSERSQSVNRVKKIADKYKNDDIMIQENRITIGDK
jgi:hypothetical protein